MSEDRIIHNSEYDAGCTYDAGEDSKGRIGRCSNPAGHSGEHWIVWSWDYLSNPYADVWERVS